MLRLNDNRFVQHTSKFARLQFVRCSKLFFNWCVFVTSYFLWPESGGHNIFNAAKLPTIWLKIPKSVIVTDSPLSSFKYLMYLAKMCCDSKMCSWLVDIPGRDPAVLLWVWWVSLALSRFHTFVLPHADSHTISVLYTNDTAMSPVLFLL